MGQNQTAALAAAEFISAMKAFAEIYSNEFVSSKGADDDLDGLYDLVVRSVEGQLIEVVLKKCQGNKLRAAKVLGLHRNTLSTKIAEFKLEEKASVAKKQRKTKAQSRSAKLKSKKASSNGTYARALSFPSRSNVIL